MKKIFRIITVSLLLLIIIQTLPVFFLKNPRMDKIEGNYVTVYYDSHDLNGAKQIFEELEDTVQSLREKLAHKYNKKTDVYVYSRQRDLHIRKLGLISLFFDVGWYIGDNRGDIALIVSPYSYNEYHNEESILSAAAHELVHTINYLKNRNLSYFLDNGIASYLAGQKAPEKLLQYSRIPEIEFLDIRNQLKFGNSGGYEFSYTYVEFLTVTYGWESVVNLIDNEDYENTFGKSRMKIYGEWVLYLKENYS